VLSRSERLRAWDAAVVDAAHEQVAVRPELAALLQDVSRITHPNTVRVVTAGLVAGLWGAGHRRRALWLGSTIAVGGALDPVLKEAVARARPAFEHPVALAPGYSFPSGHALNSMLLAACLVVLLHTRTRGHPWRRTALWGGALLLVLITGVDRVGLGVHYTTDVVAGWSVALTTVALTTTAFEHWRRRVGLRPSSRDAGWDPVSPAMPRSDSDRSPR
jgi:membrane-associated phospholipid phosphatase